MKKSSLRTLKERSIASSISKNNTYAQLLKRKRNEKRRTLEELAYGICSPSYLSKIENANVEVDEQYYQLLFEKLDIPYENILTNRNSQIFQEMIKKYLLYQYDEIQMIVNDAISSNTYCETELELLLLFSNIIRGFYEEAKLLMVKLEDLRNSLNNKELLFFVYLTALYFYKTNQTERAYQYLLVLCEIKYEDEIFKFAVYDLATEVFYLYGAYALFYQYYHLITTLEPVFLIAKRVTNHRMRALVLNASYTNILATEEMESFKTIIDLNDEEQRENYYYYLGCCYYQTNQYLKVLESTRDVKSARINALIASALNRIGDIKTALNYFDDLKLNNLGTEIKRYPQLIFLDLNMPVMGGWEFLDHFAKEEYRALFKDCKVIVLSSTIDPDDINKAKTYPMVLDFLSKPISKEMLENLKKILL